MKILICLKSVLASYVNHQLFLNVKWLLSIWWRHWPQPHFYSQKMSENQIFSDVCRGYTNQKLDSGMLIWLNWVIGSRPRQHPLVLQRNHQNDLNHKHIKIAKNVKTQNTLLDCWPMNLTIMDLKLITFKPLCRESLDSSAIFVKN